MDFSFPKEYQLFRRMVRDFVENEVRPLAKEIDREHRVPFETVEKLAKVGLLGVPFPQKYDGVGAGETGYCILLEELNKACPSTAAIVGTHIGIGAMSIYLGGTEEQKQKYLAPMSRGERIGAFALTEPGAGSDAAAITTRAVRDGDHYILNGTKSFITNGNHADVISVMAVTDPSLGPRGGVTAFIVEKEFPGFTVGTSEDKMGIRGSDTSELIFEDCRVPKENVLGQFGAGFITFMKTLDVGRVSLGAGCLGGAQACLEGSIQWAKTRQQFGVPIAQKQSVHFMIADMATEIEALRSLVYRAAWLVDTGQPFTKEAAMCKLFGSEVIHRCIDRTLQIHGGVGYSRDFWVERAFRDQRISEIFEGTSEIQRIVIASNIFRPEGVRISA
jgi:alkylation response protein AidB-like acyl-CoA dehydrogenase